VTTLLPLSRRRAEEFAQALEDRLAPDPTTAALFAFSDELASMPFGPTAQFQSQLRRRLVAVAADPPPRLIRTGLAERLDDWLTGWRGQRRLAFAAGMLAVVLLVGGVSLLGSRSVPGEPFYGVKRAAESVQMATAHGKLAKGHRHLQFAATRLAEVSSLVDRNTALVAAGSTRAVAGRLALGTRTTRLVLDTLSDMDKETVAGTRDLTEYWRESGQQRPLRALDTFAAGQHAQLTAVLPALPVSARASGLRALALISSVSDRAQALIDQGPCDASCRAIAGGATMSGGFDALGPLPCPVVCPGSGGTQAPAATITTVSPAPAGPLPSASPASPAGTTPPFVSSEPVPASDPPSSQWPLPSLSVSPSPVESTSPVPVDTSPPPVTTSPPSSPEPSTSESPSESPSGDPSPSADPSPSPSPSPTDLTATISPPPLLSSSPLPPVAAPSA
jgi:hypothetical protein